MTLIGLAATALAGVLFFVALPMWLGPAIKTAVEQAGPRITKTPIRLNDVEISPWHGLVQIKGLEIGNPAGFKAPAAIRLGTARIRMNVLSALSGTVVIHEILVEAPELTFEGGLSKNNFNTIRDNVMGAVPGGPAKAAGNQPDKPAASSSIRLLIREFAFRDGKMTAHVDAGPLGERDLSLGLPSIHLTDIGKETGGATPEQAVSAVLSAIARSATGAVTDSVKQMSEAGKGAVSKAVENVKGLFKK
jgi:hypothetical protein